MSSTHTEPPIADLRYLGQGSRLELQRAQKNLGKRLAGYRTPILESRLTLFSIDVVCVLVTSLVAALCWAWFAGEIFETHFAELVVRKWFWLPIAGGAWCAASWVTDRYDPAIDDDRLAGVQRTLFASLLAISVLLVGYFFLPVYIPRTFSVLFVGGMAVLSSAFRGLYDSFSAINAREHRLLLLGDHAAACELNRLVSTVNKMKMTIAGWSDQESLSKLQIDHPEDGLMRFAFANDVHEIVVSNGFENADDEIFRALVECQSNGIRVTSMADLYCKLCRQIPVKYVDSQWVLGAMQDRVMFTRIQLGLKRACDIAGALVALPFFFLIYPIVAIIIKMDSKGPVLYRQIRAGRGGKNFHIIKFRTMGNDAEKDGKAVWAQDNDPRITRSGAFLRKTRIDELPQFLNVLSGEMSLVGPRPERPELEKQLDAELPHYFIRRLVKPGITGWAQVHYKYGNTVLDSLKKLQYDAFYVKHWSLLTDVYILLKTIGVVIGRKGQ
jgi:exopolysaccharide biosynthesis polyprenyl glycosylphosphotransferase